MLMAKKLRKRQPDINEVAFRVVQQSTSEGNLCESKTDKMKSPSKSKPTPK